MIFGRAVLNLSIKQLIYSKKKLLKAIGIIIRENLISNRVKMLNDAVDKFGLKNVWTENYNLHYAKNNRVLVIRSKEDLTKITV